MKIKNTEKQKNSEKNSENSQKSQNLKPFKKGESGNLKGRPKGRRNYATLYKIALEKIARDNNKTFTEIEAGLIQKGYERAYGGDYRFYQDFMDRGFGKPDQPIEGEILKIILSHEIINRDT